MNAIDLLNSPTSRKLGCHTLARRAARLVAFAAALAAGTGCAEQGDPGASQTALSAIIGPAGGHLQGDRDGPYAGLELLIPAGALDADTEITITRLADGAHALPEAATGCGPMFAIEPAGLALKEPAQVKLPYDDAVVTDAELSGDEVKVWVETAAGWGRELQFESSDDTVSIELGELAVVAAGINRPNPDEIVEFTFTPVAQFKDCLAQYPGDARRPPVVQARIIPLEGRDRMIITGRNIKPGLGFDLFSIEHSLLGADGQRDPNFAGFGLAWYQADLEANSWGRVRQVIKTILLDESFGLDAEAGLPPTRTFHMGFWFNNPEDAAACGFNPANPTPFNGEQQAGPLAMTSLPDAWSGLGPLCTDPETCQD
ncbi:MAG: hypothetical protein H6730_29595 [Deltaproteobacteria bacterium]|nr:hypothetical protein [Deltaproteobacteria bacterium]